MRAESNTLGKSCLFRTQNVDFSASSVSSRQLPVEVKVPDPVQDWQGECFIHNHKKNQTHPPIVYPSWAFNDRGNFVRAR